MILLRLPRNSYRDAFQATMKYAKCLALFYFKLDVKRTIQFVCVYCVFMYGCNIYVEKLVYCIRRLKHLCLLFALYLFFLM